MLRRSAGAHLLGLIAAAVLPVWLFAAYLLVQYAVQQQARFEQDALQTARQVSLLVEAELINLQRILDGLSKSATLANGDLKSFHDEAGRLVQGMDQVIALNDADHNQLATTGIAQGGNSPLVEPTTAEDSEKLKSTGVLVSNVFVGQQSGGYRVAVTRRVLGPKNEEWLLSISVPSARIRDVMLPAVPAGWTVGIGVRGGNYIARSTQHENMTGKPGLAEYVDKIIGLTGNFKSRDFEGTTLLAGYYRSTYSGTFGYIS
ncbi:hypothetical protein NKH19_23110 [Mesorhizobium sp. M1338]|uniref:hypothetical protein n=1 Tax=unclassified Mesorhizobium TaxID=325217 RepID=UPI003339130D